jgi:hypothetical protein
MVVTWIREDQYRAWHGNAFIVVGGHVRAAPRRTAVLRGWPRSLQLARPHSSHWQ